MKDYHWLLRTGAIGIAMGAAEVVPGVSGGTIAFVSGIYERLVNGIRNFTPALFSRLRHDGFRSTWRSVDATFLVVLFGGMGVSVLALASGVSYLLQFQPVAIWSFFFGLVVASSIVVIREISAWGFDIVLALLVGLVTGITITGLVPIEVEPSPLMLFAGGAVAVCAWILPGLSGSFILLILGLYTFVIDAIKSFDIASLSFVAAGCVLGLISFSQLLSRMFSRHRNETLAVLTGFMLGSLGKLWPWKNTVSYQIKADGSQIPLVQEPVLPDAYTHLTGQEADILLALVFAITGVLVVWILDRLSGAGEGSRF